MSNVMVAVSELVPGDVIRVRMATDTDDAFIDATVQMLLRNGVKVIRPFISSAPIIDELNGRTYAAQTRVGYDEHELSFGHEPVELVRRAKR